MAHRRPSMFEEHSNMPGMFDTHSASIPSPLTRKGGSQMMYGDPESTGEARESFRRRTTPVVGEIEQRPTTLQEVLAMLNGAQ